MTIPQVVKEKVCAKCGFPKPARAFQKHRRSWDGLQPWCRGCQNNQVTATRNLRLVQNLCQQCGIFPRQGERKFCAGCLETRSTFYAEAKAWCVAYKGGACMDCGLVTAHLAVYDFHHRDPSLKDGTVMAIFSSWERLPAAKAELDKCDMLCANCHRIRHTTGRLEAA